MRRRWFLGIMPLVVAVSLLLGPLGGSVPALARAASVPPMAPEALLHPGPADAVLAQIPSGVLNFVTEIAIPNWMTAPAPTFDILSFDPVRRIMYASDRPKNAVTALDTRTNQVVGMVPMPADCVQVFTERGRSCPSGVQVASDLRRLIVTDRGSPGVTNPPPPIGDGNPQPADTGRVMIFDISQTPTPQGAPLATIQVGSVGAGNALEPDELDYDPVNHRVYVGNTAGAPFVTVIQLLKTAPWAVAVGQISLAQFVTCSPPPPTWPNGPPSCGVEQPRFDPVDTLIYQNLSDDARVLRIDPDYTHPASPGTIRENVSVAPCRPNGLDIDPLTDTALLGCSTGSGPQVLLNLRTLSPLPVNGANVTGTDAEYFSNHLRRWYTASQNNLNVSVPPCPTTPGSSPPVFPVVGVFTAGRAGAPSPATGVGVACSGLGSHALGVDPIGDNVYVPTASYPLVGGQPGVLVFHDPARPAQRPVNQAQAALVPLVGEHALGTVKFQDGGREVEVSLQHLPRGAPDELVITTTVGNEVVHCADRDPRRYRDDGQGEDASCHGHLIGAPLIRGLVTLAVGGKPIAQGTILRSGGEPNDD
jgi:hypothetical protein